MVWQWVIQLIIAAVFFVIGELMRPPPDIEDADATPFEEVNLPLVDMSRRQSVIWGKVDYRSPHVMDVTEYNTIAITTKIKKNAFSSVKKIIGYRYFLGMQLGLTSPSPTLHRIYLDDRELWAGTAAPNDNGVSIAIDEPEFFGGPEFGGGVVGTFRYYAGGVTQNQSSYLAGFQSTCPNYRWTSFLQLENVELGESPGIQNIAVQLSRYPDPLALAGDNTIGDDINPMSIMYEVLRDQDYGFGMDASEITTASFTGVAAVLKTEANGMSLKWVNEQTIDRLIDQINKQVGGILRYNPTSGEWEYKLLRDDYSIPGLKTFDASTIKELTSYSRSNWDETFNEVRVTWNQRELVDKPAPAIATDRSNFIRQGRNKIHSLNLPGCYSSATANAIASRELFELGAPLAKAEMLVTRDAFDLLPGDPFIFKWDDLGITQIIMRVADLGYGDDEFQTMALGAVQDVFAIVPGIFSDPPVSLFTSNAGLPIDIPAADQFAHDMPWWLNIQNTEQAAIPGSEHQAYTAAAQPQGSALNYDVNARLNGSGDPFLVENVAYFSPKGELVAAMSEEAGGNNDEIATVLVENVSLTGALQAAAETEATIKQQQWNFVVIVPASGEPEFLAYESLTISGSDVTMNAVHRGLFDTLPVAHELGADVFFITGPQIEGLGSTDTDYGAAIVVDIRLVNRNNQGTATAATTLVVTFRNRVNKPYPAGGFEVNTDRYPAAPQALDSDLDFAWVHRDRLDDLVLWQSDASDDQNSSPGGNGGAGEEGTEYVLLIYDDVLNNLERTVRASGGDDTFTTNTDSGVTYDYTLAKQQADGGPFARVRAELTVRDTTTSEENLLDVIRIFTVTIPLDFLRRGPLYWAAVEEEVGTIYPATTDFPMVAAIGGAGDMTEIGDVGIGAPGPHPMNQFMAFAGDDVGAGWKGNGEMPDAGDFDQTNNKGWIHSFSVRCVRDAQTLRRNILIHDTDGGVPLVGWYFGTHLVSGVDGLLTWYWQSSASTQPTAGFNSARRQLDDGKWHRVTMFKPTNVATGCGIMIDGCWCWIKATAMAVGTTADFSVGGYSGLSSWGFQKMHLGMYGAQDDDGTALADVVRAAISAQPWTPWVSMNAQFASYTWGRCSGAALGQGRQLSDWSDSERNADSSDLQPALNNKTSPVNAMVNGNSGAWDEHFHDSPITEGGPSCHAADLGGNGFRCGNDFWPSKNVQGPQVYGSFAIINPDSFPASTDIRLWTYEDVNLGGETDVGELYVAWVDVSGFIRISIETSQSNYRVHRTDAQCVFDTVWNYIWIVNRLTTGWEVWVNGVEFSVDDSFATNGTVPAVDTMLNDRNEGGSLSSSFYHVLGNGQASSDQAPGANGSNVWPGRAAEYGETLDIPAAKDIRILYAATFKPFPTMVDVLLDFAPDHVFQILDNADVDLRGVMTAVTATGTWSSDEEVPLPSDDGTFPQRFNGGERLRYTTQAFKGTGALNETAFILIAQIWDDAADMTFFANHRADDANSSTNYSVFWDFGTGELRYRDNAELANTAMIKTNGDVFCMAMRQTATGTEFQFFEGGSIVNQLTQATAAPADTMGELSLGARGTATEDLNGNIHYLAMFERYVAERILRRAQLKYRGMNGALLEIHSHIDSSANADDAGKGFIFPLAELDQSASGVENWNIIDATIQNLTLTGSHTSLRHALGCLGVPRIAQYASGSFVAGAGYNGNGAYPFTLGGWVRVDSGADAMFCVSLDSVSDQFIAVGIIAGKAAARIAVSAASVDETGSTTVTAGDMAFVCMTFISDTSRKLYLNGALETEFTTSRDVNGQVLAAAGQVGINRIVGPDTDFAGSYQMVFGVDKELTDAHHAVLYREAQHFGWRAMTVADGAIAQWLLDEPSEFTTVFRDQFNDDYNALEVSTGVTQDVIGILPSAPGICVDLDGTNDGIDTNYLGYPTGTTNRALEVWLEGGFVGTVCSMGANTDANALVISVDGSGDISIHIRGSGNERIWTTALDAGTEHHLLVELDGDSLHDFNIWIDGVVESTISTAGTDTTLATTATLDLHIGQDITDIGKADGNGKMYGFTVYDAAPTPFATTRVALHNSLGRERLTGQS